MGAVPHSSADPRPDETRRQRALYEGEIAFTDRHVGRVLDALERLGLIDATIVGFDLQFKLELLEQIMKSITFTKKP